MNIRLSTVALILAFAVFGYGQDSHAEPVPADPGSSPHNSSIHQVTPEMQDSADRADAAGKADDPGPPPPDYRRPSAEKRLKNYLNNVAGPFAVVQYVGTAGLLTARNSPKEWGAKRDGFERRLANQFGKSLIKNTTIYALDEALEIDSKFYRSRERSLAGRLRNAVFSSVTARNRRGERVIGYSRIAGSLAAEVVSSTVWYPERYNVLHGIKGGGIAIGVNVGVNLLKEFVWK